MQTWQGHISQGTALKIAQIWGQVSLEANISKKRCIKVVSNVTQKISQVTYFSMICNLFGLKQQFSSSGTKVYNGRLWDFKQWSATSLRALWACGWYIGSSPFQSKYFLIWFILILCYCIVILLSKQYGRCISATHLLRLEPFVHDNFMKNTLFLHMV